MADLKRDLDEYLLLQSDTKKSTSNRINLPQIRVPDVTKLFSNSSPKTENNTRLESIKNYLCPELSRLQRIIGFLACIGIGTICLVSSIFYIPVLILKARKFALLYTMASFFFILSLCFLLGFGVFLQQTFSKGRVLISGFYTACLCGALYFALFNQITLLTVLFAILQTLTLLYLIVDTIPGAGKSIKFFGQIFKSSISASNVLPV
ncbi:protein transport protein sft2 [Teleopsis dalmanni]|uniref:protein transport protein sft2 n=1 Tax=Teleopsis dalmanni TaxID=139649 RepID=UPI0018CCD9FC|nr:protein transport protein sft2 [Teleopsis dalmanni]